MKLYEIVNPSDALTFKAPNIEIAAGVVLFLGTGKYGAEEITDEPKPESTPVLLGWEPWIKEHNMEPLTEWIEKNTPQVVASLKTVMLGNAADRQDLEEMLKALPNDKSRRKFILERNHRRRSSMNDIESYAHKLAINLEKAS